MLHHNRLRRLLGGGLDDLLDGRLHMLLSRSLVQVHLVACLDHIVPFGQRGKLHWRLVLALILDRPVVSLSLIHI